MHMYSHRSRLLLFCSPHHLSIYLQKKQKRKEKGNRKDRSALLNDDPLANGDEDDDVARMAREMEEKYV